MGKLKKTKKTRKKNKNKSLSKEKKKIGQKNQIQPEFTKASDKEGEK